MFAGRFFGVCDVRVLLFLRVRLGVFWVFIGDFGSLYVFIFGDYFDSWEVIWGMCEFVRVVIIRIIGWRF